MGIGTSRPTGEVAYLLRLLKLRIERIDPGIGIEQFRLVAPHAEPLHAVDLGAVLVGETHMLDPARLVDVVVKAHNKVQAATPGKKFLGDF